MATEDKKVEGQEQQETGEQQENKKSKLGLIKKVCTIGERIVTGGLAAVGCYALYKALKPEPKTGSTESHE